MHPSRRRYFRYAFWAWTVIAGLGATVGGVVGWLEVENDTRT